MEVTRDFVIRDILRVTTNGFTKQGVRFKPPTPQSISFGGFFIFIDKFIIKFGCHSYGQWRAFIESPKNLNGI
jgi:hypothetical protein